MKYLYISVALIFCVLANTNSYELVVKSEDEILDQEKFITPDPDQFHSVQMLITSKGYPVEDHPVQTEDGYTLNLHRIPFGRNEQEGNILNKPEQRPVVLCQHGLLDSSATFVANFPGQSLGFYLADNGYDVWLGNIRGNTNSLVHEKFNTTQDEFWSFSWDEMAKYDLPAMVNYILKVTGQSQLIYIGHSQGTLIGFAAFSENQELASKIKLFVALAPVAHVAHIKSPVKLLADMGWFTNQQMWYTIFGRRDFLPSNDIIRWMSQTVCNLQAFDQNLCANVIFLIAGPSDHVNKTRMAVYTSHMPAGSSVRNLVHFAQLVKSNKFQKYDYGSKKENLKHYNQATPPLYDLKKVNVPVAIYSAKKDWLSPPADVKVLRNNLPNIVDDFDHASWSHLDFTLAVDTVTQLYRRMLNLMSQY